jgi:5-methylcytosine-specific restriction endonuclease McrA
MFMDVIDQETREEFRLYFTEELSRQLAEYDDKKCSHQDAEIRWFRASNGAVHHKRQCLKCGELVGQAISKSLVPANCLSDDESLRERYGAQRRHEKEEILQRHIRIQKTGDSKSQKEYEAYLQSPQWRAVRAKVMKRADGLCEGCGALRPTQVHHLSYDHKFNEFLFELVAVCDQCHERLHRETGSDPDEWGDDLPCGGCRFQNERNHRRWCGALDVLAVEALSEGGGCGPAHAAYEPLK